MCSQGKIDLQKLTIKCSIKIYDISLIFHLNLIYLYYLQVDTQCYLSYVTQYTPTTEDVCSDNYRKKCYIEYTKTAVTETIEKCIIPMERICSPPKYGEVQMNSLTILSEMDYTLSLPKYIY